MACWPVERGHAWRFGNAGDKVKFPAAASSLAAETPARENLSNDERPMLNRADSCIRVDRTGFDPKNGETSHFRLYFMR